MPKLAFEDVSLRYDDGQLLALEDLNLAVEAGESVAVIGPSGCGKSSMLQMAAGLLQPTSGAVRIDEAPVERPRQKTALILQDFGLLPWKTVQANAELGLKVRGIDKDARSKRAAEALAQVGLADFAQAFPAELSGGMQQRLALARAIALHIDLLLMDEPLSALDALLREQMQDMLLELWQREGYAQVLVTHSIDEAVFLGQRIVVMSPRPGHVIAVKENPAMGTPGHRGSEAFFDLVNELRELLRSSCLVDSEEAPHE